MKSGQGKWMQGENLVNIGKALQILSLPSASLYRRIASDHQYAARIVKHDNTLEIHKVIREQISNPDAIIGSSPGAFDLWLDTPLKKISLYGNHFSVATENTPLALGKLRKMAQLVFPLYQRISNDPIYASQLAKAILSKNKQPLFLLIRRSIPSSLFVKAEIVRNGFALSFQFPDAIIYENALGQFIS